MYIGSTDQRGLHHLVYEIVDNAIDEAMADYCDHVLVTLHEDNSVSVRDNGRGIPTDLHATTGRPALETIMTTLHAGGKFGGGAYKVSGGLHGVGASVVNALSESMRVEVRRDGQVHSQEFERGIPLHDVVDEGPIPENASFQNGTLVRFMADTEVFGPPNYDRDALIQRFREMAYLNKGIWLSFASEAHPDADRTFYFEGGIASFVKQLNQNREVLQDEPFYYEEKTDHAMVEVALQYNTGFYESTLAFANCINTADGGTHLVGFRAGLTRAINNYAKKSNSSKRMSPTSAATMCARASPLSLAFGSKNPSSKARPRASSATPKPRPPSSRPSYSVSSTTWRSTRRRPGASSTSASPPSAPARPRERRGTSSSARTPWTAARCPASSPTVPSAILNYARSTSWRATPRAAPQRWGATAARRPSSHSGARSSTWRRPARTRCSHTRRYAPSSPLGAGLGEDFNLPKLRYHKVIIMTDADVDGAHIRTLLLTFFFRNMRQLIDGGHLYIAQPPLYRTSRGRSVEYKYSEAEKDTWLAKQLFGRLSIQSSDGAVSLSGPKIQGLVNRLKEFENWTRPLSSLGLAPELVGTFLQGAEHGAYRLSFEGEQTVDAVVDWLTAQGFECRKVVNKRKKEYFIEAPGHGTINVPRVLESAMAHRAQQLFPQMAQWVNGHTYMVSRRDNEVATGVPWHDLAHVLERNSERQGIGLQRYKGLGEMNPDQLWETTMNPARARCSG